MDSNQYNDLFRKLLDGKLSSEEAETLVAWLGKEELDPQAAGHILDRLNESVADNEISPEIRDALEARLPAILQEHTESGAPVRRIPVSDRRWFRYAAAVVLLLGASAFFLWGKLSNTTAAPDTLANEKIIDIPPGSDGAILTLSDGRTLILDSLGNGIIATQNGTQIVLKDGQLLYDADAASGKEIAYNSITTPKGRQFQLVLPDGSKVWLNAASSLRYPILFAGKERKVEITGEAYFEVARDREKPFRVKVNEQTTVEVLGTHFNINSYANESDIKTTLLEGSVRIINGQENVVIKPGQQAKVDNSEARASSQSGHITVLNAVNLDKVMAWKNGVFDFQDASLEEIMRQLERWYDIEVVYEKGVPKLEFVGKIGRDLNLSEVIRGLELSKVHCRLEGRKLVVMP